MARYYYDDWATAMWAKEHLGIRRIGPVEGAVRNGSMVTLTVSDVNLYYIEPDSLLQMMTTISPQKEAALRELGMWPKVEEANDPTDGNPT